MFNNYGPYMYQTPRFNFSNLLNNASKTLNVVNQAIPVIKEVKPIFKNAKALFKIVNVLNNSNPTEEVKINKENTNSGPNFFI